MASEEERVLNLFDFYWFGHKTFIAKQHTTSDEPNPDPVFQIHQQTDECKLPVSGTHQELQEPRKLSLSRIPTLHTRSLSDDCLTSSFESLSPNSVLAPKLQTILSGKEAEESSEKTQKQGVKKPIKKIRRRRKGSGRSLSELEFKELKGFMDLGFVFTEKDKNSNDLVSILPGLQRLGKEVDNGGDEEEEEEKGAVSRPYLSEAWDVLKQSKVEKPLMVNRRIGDLGNEMDMKEHLRIWAHKVASTVR
ncbi:hypothetical protein NMG60_11005251 [Bertholletia excelsa]